MSDPLTPDAFERELARYLYESAEEARAVRVGEKDTSEQAAIVARYSSLFTRDQHAALKHAEVGDGDEGERLARLGDACEGGIVMAELADRLDALENAILACRVEHDGEEMPLRAAQAALAVIDEYASRDRLGAAVIEASAGFNDERLALLQAGEALETELSGIEDPVRRSAERKQIDLHRLADVLEEASAAIDAAYGDLRERWLDGSSARSARTSPRPLTSPTSDGSRRWPTPTRRSGRCRSAWRR